MYRICLSMLRQATDAEDATQEVFLKVLDRAHQFREQARFSTWLHRLTVNLCLHRIEKESLRSLESIDLHQEVRDTGFALVDASPSPLEAAAGSEANGRLQGLLARLPPPSRAVLVLRELEELSYAEIAEVLSIPIGTVMSRLARARERMAALLPVPPANAQTERSAS